MNVESILERINFLLDGGSVTENIYASSQEKLQAAISLMATLYGPNSPQVERLQKDVEALRAKGPGISRHLDYLAVGALQNLKGELEAGLVGDFQRIISGEVLSDFLQLSRTALNEKGDDAKNVASVLAAALYEDTIRRLAKSSGIPHIEKLQDVITELKNKGIIQGSQVGIATSYLNFRNNALHAQWDKIERESVASALSFVEQLLLKHFS